MGRNICQRNLYCPPLGKPAWTTIASKVEKDVYTVWIGPSKKVFTQNWSRWWPLSIKLNSTNELQGHLSNKGEVRLKRSIKVGWKCTIVGRDYEVEIAATKNMFLTRQWSSCLCHNHCIDQMEHHVHWMLQIACIHLVGWQFGVLQGGLIPHGICVNRL